MIALALLVGLIGCFSPVLTETCPRPWTLEKIADGAGRCICGDLLGGVIKCDTDSLELQVLESYCMTYSSTLNTTVGHCSLTFYHLYNVLGNVTTTSELNSVTCGDFHRTGVLCGQCEEGYAPPAYSYSLSCVECSNYKYNWLKYIAIALLPLTLFYMLVLIFRISALSGNMDVFVLICQSVTTPGIMRLHGLYLHSTSTTFRLLFQTVVSVYSLWNLDFFRTIYAPFCVHPKWTSLQVLILDYIIAVYPLLLICITYVCVYLHDNYHSIVLLWSPFYKCFARIRREWHIRKSLIDVFATFLLLSFTKIFNVSICILAPSALYNVHGQKLRDYALYFDGSVKSFGKDHIPYAILAIVMLILFNITPTVVLLLYPFRVIQNCLNRAPYRLQAMHTFVDAFQGSFKIAPYDCRYFAAFFLVLRMVNLVAQVSIQSSLFSPFMSATFFIATLIVSYMKPRRYSWHNLIDTVLLATMTFGSCLFFVIVTSFFSVAPYLDSYGGNQRYIIDVLIALFPLVYLLMLLVYSLTPKVVLIWCRKRYSDMKNCKWRRGQEIQLEDPNEKTPLLTQQIE